jgi:4-azaleucine resistance transporter AzlC
MQEPPSANVSSPGGERRRRLHGGRRGGGRPSSRAAGHRSDYLAGARAMLALLPAIWLFGASFGVLARSAGFDPFATIAMSATTFAGSAQFAAVSVLGAGGTVLAAVVAAVLLNARYAPMGLAAARSFVGGRPRRVLESQLLVDESWAFAQQDGRFDRRRLIGAGLVLYAGWVGGTALGVAAGGSLGDPATLGLDAAFPALFLALMVPLVRTRNALAAATGGAGLALLLTPLAPAGVPVIAAVLAAGAGLLPERSPARPGSGLASEQPDRPDHGDARTQDLTPRGTDRELAA